MCKQLDMSNKMKEKKGLRHLLQHNKIIPIYVSYIIIKQKSPIQRSLFDPTAIHVIDHSFPSSLLPHVMVFVCPSSVKHHFGAEQAAVQPAALAYPNKQHGCSSPTHKQTRNSLIVMSFCSIVLGMPVFFFLKKLECLMPRQHLLQHETSHPSTARSLLFTPWFTKTEHAQPSVSLHRLYRFTQPQSAIPI